MIVMRQRAWGVLRVWGFGQHSVRVLEDGQNGVGGAVGDQSWIGMGSWQSDGDLDNLTLTK